MSNASEASNHSPITADSTVDAVLAATPSALGVLNEYLIDTCCGGKATVGEAAAHAHADPATVVRALQKASSDLPVSKSCNCGCR